ncbi:hypothetical protein ACFL2V_15900 [Pseudomonadota bacterium]
MTTTINIPSADESEWVLLLKPYQQSTINKFLKKCSAEEAAEKWLGSTGSPNIATFGGGVDTKPFWERFKSEFKKFICDDKAYVDEKESLMAEGPVAKAILISVISAAIGATIGYTATLLAPPVALLLCSVGKIGLNAYCDIEG